jgi:hypothetical protein
MNKIDITNCPIGSCANTWYDLNATSNDNVKHCKDCKTDVYKATNMEEFLTLLNESKCVAYFEKEKEMMVGGLEKPYGISN